VRQCQPSSIARGLQNDGAHGVGHALNDDGHLDAAGDQLPDGIVDGEAVGDVSARAVDVERDRPVVVVGHLAHPFDHTLREILFDVADQIDIAQTVGGLLAENAFHGVDQIENETIVEIAVRELRDL
jgi:hypothetical protein